MVEKVHEKSLSVCMQNNSCYFISNGSILLVLITHRKFELDRWIQKLFIVKPRATPHRPLKRQVFSRAILLCFLH